MLGEQTGIFKLIPCWPACRHLLHVFSLLLSEKRCLQNAVTNRVPASFSGYSTLNKTTVEALDEWRQLGSFEEHIIH